MGNQKKYITTENVNEWLSSTGFLFPRNELELARFEKLFGSPGESLTGKEIDPARIISGKFKGGKIVKLRSVEDTTEANVYKMVARNGSTIPKHILDKMKKNQESRKNDIGSAKEED